MRLVGLRVRNYRTIGSVEQSLPLEQSLTIVGPNNTGKTNLLRAIQLFFIGHENDGQYSPEVDKTFGVGSGKTSLLATFDGDDTGADPLDDKFYADLDKLIGLYDRAPRSATTFSLSLQFSDAGTPTYQFFPNWKKPESNSVKVQISRSQRLLVTDLLARFSCHYVPSAKSVSDIYGDVLLPFLRKVAARAIEPQVVAIKEALDGVATRINEELRHVGLEELSASFDMPGGSHEDMLAGFDFNMSDPHSTPLMRKGQGIQSTALLAGFLWVAEEERKSGKEPIWLLEEPESYLHPQLTESSRALLEQLGKQCLVATTTHSLAFVPQDPKIVVGTLLEDGATQVRRFATYKESTDSLRRALGVRFSDFYSMGRYNVLVEGQSDRELFNWFLALAEERGRSVWNAATEANFLDFGGVTGLDGFLRATWDLISQERATVTVFDGDDAGTKTIRGLQGFFGRKNIPFQPNRDFVVVRKDFAVEGLFPDPWLRVIHEEHPDWFISYIEDSSGFLMEFRLHDSRKGAVQNVLCSYAEDHGFDEWSERWVALFDAIEAALHTQEERLDK